MADETTTTAGGGAAAPFDPAGSMDKVQDTIHRFLEAAKVEAVYGEPVRNGDTVVIPTAEVLSFMGFGMGYGSGTGEGKGEEPVGGSGAGGGGGGRILSRPVAAIIMSPEGVRAEPIVDVTKLGLAALTALGFMAATMMRMSRGKR
jgi:uncharacterized spore protein YtfJ